MTHMNIDYKHFTGTQDPIDVINKYRMRGFGTFINKDEQTHMIEYNGSNDVRKKMFSINLKDKSSKLNHFGSKLLSDNIYKPNHFSKGIPISKYNKISHHQYIITTENLYTKYKDDYNYTKSGVDLLSYTTINKNGDVEPLKKWLLEAAYDKLKDT